MSNETTKRFEDRKSAFPNRRRLTILSQTPNTIIADVERADEPITENGVVKEGTPVTADVLNEWDGKVNDMAKTLSDLTSSVDCSQAGEEGTPEVTIVEKDGKKQFCFKNLKGKTGSVVGTYFYLENEPCKTVRFAHSNGTLKITTEK